MLSSENDFLLVFDLKIEMTGEPVVEDRWLDVARRQRLTRHPVEVAFIVNIHSYVVHLGHKHKPVTLQKPKHNSKHNTTA